MSAWFHYRCTFKDQYALWHTILKLASRFGCLEYDNDILRMKYWVVKDLKAERTSLLLDCSIIERKCPLFPYARPCAAEPPDLLDAVYHHTMRRGATFDTGSLVVENACFEKRVRTVPPCEIPSSLSTYAAWLGLDALRDFDMPFITEVVLAELDARGDETGPPPSVPFFKNNDEESLFLRMYGTEPGS